MGNLYYSDATRRVHAVGLLTMASVLRSVQLTINHVIRTNEEVGGMMLNRKESQQLDKAHDELEMAMRRLNAVGNRAKVKPR